MNLSHLSDTALDQELNQLAKLECEVLTKVLHHLREAEKRRLYSKFGYKSLFTYAVERFGYTEDEAYRRISAMRLLRDVPQIEAKIESGSLSLTNISKAQTLFRQEQKDNRERTAEEKALVLEKLENCSKMKAEKILECFKQDSECKVRPLLSEGLALAHGPQLAEHRFQADKELQANLNRLFELTNLPHAELAKLMKLASEIALDKLDPVRKAERAAKRMEAKQDNIPEKSSATESAGTKKSVAPTSVATVNSEHPIIKSTAQTSGPDQKPRVTKLAAVNARPANANPNRYIPSAVRHAVYMRDQGICQNCGSTRAMEMDHIKPYALGGEHSLENLRLLCRSCNQRSAIDTFGFKRMTKFLKSPVAVYF